MRRLGGPLVAVALACVALAGCASGPSTPRTMSPSTILVTRPGDYAADQNLTDAAKPHVHDYWHNQTRLDVMDGWPTEPGPGFASGSEVRIYRYQPDSGHVIPQGAAWVEVTMDWTPDPTTDVYQDAELWVQSAAEGTPHKVGPVASGQTLVLNTTNDLDDLPHQLLSAWAFEFRASQRDDVGFLRFKANVTVHVEAVRGLPIPLYPGHPDRWGGKDNLTLIDVTRMLAYMQDPGDAGCDGLSCPQTEHPQNGTIVPPDAPFVVATLTVLGSPTSIGLAVHGAESRAFHRLQPSSTEGNVRTYVIPAIPYGDGPYAKASQWEFKPVIEGPVPDTAAVEQYHLVVQAVKRL